MLKWFRGKSGATEPYMPNLPLDLFSPEFVQNPYPSLAWLRQNDPVHLGASGAWVLSRADDISAALLDPRLSNQPAAYAVVNRRNEGKYLSARVANRILPFMDGAAHAALRPLFAKAWIEQLRQRPVALRELAQPYLQACKAKGEFEFLSDFSSPFAFAVVASVLGIPHSDQTRLQPELQWFFYLFTSMPDKQTLARTEEALAALRDYFHGLLRLKEASSQDDLCSRMLAALPLAEQRDQLIDNLILLLADGVENLDSVMASALALMLEHPEQWRAVCENPTLAKAAANEVLRLESPALFIARIIQEDFEWHGRSLQAGQALLLMLASANRDESKFENAHAFDMHRKVGGGFSFGRGQHSCIGANLARKETAFCLRLFAEEMPQVKKRYTHLSWQQRLGHRWLQALPLSTR